MNFNNRLLIAKYTVRIEPARCSESLAMNGRAMYTSQEKHEYQSKLYKTDTKTKPEHNVSFTHLGVVNNVLKFLYSLLFFFF